MGREHGLRHSRSPRRPHQSDALLEVGAEPGILHERAQFVLRHLIAHDALEDQLVAVRPLVVRRRAGTMAVQAVGNTHLRTSPCVPLPPYRYYGRVRGPVPGAILGKPVI